MIYRFIYDGLDTNSRTGYSDVYVLTIPGFVWFKVSFDSNSARFQHTCEVAGGRQLINIGGLDNQGVATDY